MALDNYMHLTDELSSSDRSVKRAVEEPAGAGVSLPTFLGSFALVHPPQQIELVEIKKQTPNL